MPSSRVRAAMWDAWSQQTNTSRNFLWKPKLEVLPDEDSLHNSNENRVKPLLAKHLHCTNNVGKLDVDTTRLNFFVVVTREKNNFHNQTTKSDDQTTFKTARFAMP